MMHCRLTYAICLLMLGCGGTPGAEEFTSYPPASAADSDAAPLASQPTIKDAADGGTPSASAATQPIRSASAEAEQ